jgi:hypothetical protein
VAVVVFSLGEKEDLSWLHFDSIIKFVGCRILIQLQPESEVDGRKRGNRVYQGYKENLKLHRPST